LTCANQLPPAEAVASLLSAFQSGTPVALVPGVWFRLFVFLALFASLDYAAELSEVGNTSKSAEPEIGVASWYGYPFHGRRAANGEVYDMEQMTAAHKTLPFNTRVQVHNIANNRTVEVRINDRGPFIDGRIIDLSRAAARSLGLLDPGIAPVAVEIIGAQAVEQSGVFAVQVGAFRDIDNAVRCVTEMRTRHGVARLVPRDGTPILWRVLVGSEVTQAGASELAARLRGELPAGSAFVARVN
jgi:rare lipoprotein A